MFLPFYLPGKDRLKVVIVGGGYAGLSALVTLREYRADAEIVLIDARAHHLKITHLQETFRRPLDEFRVPFPVMERRFGIRFVQAELAFDETLLARWNTERFLSVNGESIDFDYLLLATGTGYERSEPDERVLALEDFTRRTGSELLEQALAGAGPEPWITVVGGGASGIQFLFELHHHLGSRRLPGRLRLVDSEAAPLKQFHPNLGRYVQARMGDLGIEHVPDSFYRGREGDRIVLEGRATGERSELPSALTLLFLGKGIPDRLHANRFGQIISGGATLARCFTAGDCSYYPPPGSNVMSAQSALRKGKLAARNILRSSGRLPLLLEPYFHRDLGYLVNLGPEDAVGWLALERNVVAGRPAAVVKDIVEAQYDLLLAGIDTYLL